MRRTPLLVAAALVGGLLSVLPALPASAEEVYDRPADGVFDVEGHGWGHGRGMSQWGAQGAATQGRTADEIAGTYYPGTQRSVLPDAPVRVWLSADEGRDTTVYAAQGLTATDVSTGTTTTLPPGPTEWRVRGDADGLHLESLTGGTWTTGAATPGPVRFGGTTFTRVLFPGGTSRDYRGSVTAVRDGSGLRTVDVLSLEDYLLGVVPREASSSWLPAALQAQAIAARSYSAYQRAHVAAGAAYDICDSTACQVFGGSRLYTSSGGVTQLEAQSTTDAVHATAGVVRTLDGAPVFAEFSSSNGGWSTAGSRPYLQAHEDPWDGAAANPVHSWTASLPVSALERRFPGVGTLQRLRVTQRDGNGEWGGRVQQVVLEGTGGTVTTTGAGVYDAATWPGTSTGLRSTWFHLKADSTSSEVVTQSTAPSLVRPPGASTGVLTVTLRNTGSTTWPASGLHLAVNSPPGQADALAGQSTRPGRYTGSGDVPPGGTADFQVALDAAGVAAGTHTRVYRARIDDGPVFGAPVTWQVPVADALFTAVRAASPTAATAPPSPSAPPAVSPDGSTVVVTRGGTVTVRLRARNTGNVPWPGDGTVQLGTSGPRDRSSASRAADWPSASRAASTTRAVAPGGTATFDLDLAGAGRPAGLTFESFEPVWAGRHWLDGAVTRLAVVRTDPSVPRLAMVHSVPTAFSVPRGGTGTLVVRLRNLGGSAWTVGRDQLTTSSPEPLRTRAWRSSTRPPALAANASRPSVRVVQPGEIGEWRVPLAGLTRGSHTMTVQAVVGSAGYGPRTAVTVTVP